MPNPLNYVTPEKIAQLGLSLDDIRDSYHPSEGGVYHARGAESKGKTLLIAHLYRELIDKGLFTPADAVGNLAFKGKYGIEYQIVKGEDLRQYLWDLTHKPYRHKIVVIDEADSEFPARFFTDKEQTEISLRLWHTAKLGNYIYLSSHLGNSVDVIMSLATHYYLYPNIPSFESNTLNYTMFNRLEWSISNWTAHDVIATMLIYNRQELTENTQIERFKARPSKQKEKQTELKEKETELNFDLEWEEIERV